MAEYIDCRRCDSPYCDGCNLKTLETMLYKGKLDCLMDNNRSTKPTADVVEVVRCKDCERCFKKRTKRNKQLMLFCMRMDGREYQVNANDFCSYGLRKGDNNAE